MTQDKHSFIGLGNPLLDVMASCDEEFLKKYDLKPNDAILADTKHAKLCSEMLEKFNVQYLAGGSVQNTMRVAQWFFKEPNVCVFFGCVGDDDFGRQMKRKAEEDHVNAVYMVDSETPTGTCACLITKHGKHRSLCAYLGASQKFSIDHVKKNIELVESARIYYVSGFHLIISLEPTLLLAKHAHQFQHKLFVINLSAPYISEFYSEQLLQVMPYVDLLFGNDSEANSFAKMQNWETTDVKEIAQKIADWEPIYRPRTVIITQGKRPIIVAFSNNRLPLETYTVPLLKDEEIVDTNGAGDAFVGGYIAYLLANKPLSECMKAASFAAQEVIKQSGCTFPKENRMKL